MNEQTEQHIPDEIIIKTAGHPLAVLVARPGIASCGQIEDGIAFWHAANRRGDEEGSWLIRYADLERLYMAARAFRVNVYRERLDAVSGAVRVSDCEFAKIVDHSAADASNPLT